MFTLTDPSEQPENQAPLTRVPRGRPRKERFRQGTKAGSGTRAGQGTRAGLTIAYYWKTTGISTNSKSSKALLQY